MRKNPALFSKNTFTVLLLLCFYTKSEWAHTLLFGSVHAQLFWLHFLLVENFHPFFANEYTIRTQILSLFYNLNILSISSLHHQQYFSTSRVIRQLLCYNQKKIITCINFYNIKSNYELVLASSGAHFLILKPLQMVRVVVKWNLGWWPGLFSWSQGHIGGFILF